LLANLFGFKVALALIIVILVMSVPIMEVSEVSDRYLPSFSTPQTGFGIRSQVNLEVTRKEISTGQSLSGVAKLQESNC
jgi:hypothetical protein